MASSLNSKRVLLLMLAAFGLAAALVCIGVLAAGLREPTRERIFLVGSLLVVSIVCLALALHFKDAAQGLEEQLAAQRYERLQRDAEDMDDAPLPQNAPAGGRDAAAAAGTAPGGEAGAAPAAAAPGEADPDEVHLPQNDPANVPGARAR